MCVYACVYACVCASVCACVWEAVEHFHNGDAGYHFAGTEGASFKLPPYQNPIHVTRFYGLGMVGNKDKVKSLEALAVATAASLTDSELKSARDAATPVPYTYEYVPPPPPEGSEAGPEGFVTGGVQPGGPSTHTEYDDGRWKCGLCGNVNYKHQKRHCHMRICNAPRYPGQSESPPPAARQIGVTSLEDARAAVAAAAAEAARKKEPKRVSLYIAQKPTKNKKSKK